MTTQGFFFFAFSNFYDVQNNTIAEAMTMRNGLLLCKEQDFHDMVLKFNSHVLVEMLCSSSCCY